jgi:CspA family cold shock protein
MVGWLSHPAAPRVVEASLLERAVRLLFGSGRERAITMATGTIKKVVADRGFGFITGEDGKDYFFHRDSLVPPLDIDRIAGGEPVTYEIENGPKGPRANTVTAA